MLKQNKKYLAVIFVSLVFSPYFYGSVQADSNGCSSYFGKAGLTCNPKGDCSVEDSDQQKINNAWKSEPETDPAKVGKWDNGIISGICPDSQFCCIKKTVQENKAKAPPVELVNPIGGSDSNKQGQTNLYQIVGGIISKALGILGSLALLVFVFGGFMWVTAAGNADKVKQGTDAMVWATIGICIIFSSYAILKLVFSGIGAVGFNATSFEKKQGQVWCVDMNTNLCMAMEKGECKNKPFENQKDCETTAAQDAKDLQQGQDN